MNNLFIKHSENINEIASALSKAQGEMKPAVFNKTNSFYKSGYADFASCMDACRIPLSKNNLAISQLPSMGADGRVVLATLLVHSSGQWMACEFPLMAKNLDDIQTMGKSITYAKRYSLCGILGIVSEKDEDDDGESYVEKTQPPRKQPNNQQFDDKKSQPKQNPQGNQTVSKTENVVPLNPEQEMMSDVQLHQLMEDLAKCGKDFTSALWERIHKAHPNILFWKQLTPKVYKGVLVEIDKCLRPKKEVINA